MKRFFVPAVIAVFLIACGDDKKDESKSTESTMSASNDTTKNKMAAPAEFADPKYVELGKKMSAQFTSGDIDGWVSNYADNAKFRWSSGDSLSGKDAIGKYWKDRRANVVDSISFMEQIWLPVKVNEPQSTADVKGVWLLSWYQVHVKYKNGAKLVFAVHNVHHFNDEGKIDETVQYMDRAPINKALGVK